MGYYDYYRQPVVDAAEVIAQHNAAAYSRMGAVGSKDEKSMSLSELITASRTGDAIAKIQRSTNAEDLKQAYPRIINHPTLGAGDKVRLRAEVILRMQQLAPKDEDSIAIAQATIPLTGKQARQLGPEDRRKYSAFLLEPKVAKK